jgi:hypothetical protein
MRKQGKTSTSRDSPDFFHLPYVSVVNTRQHYSHKSLNPSIKLSSSIENPLNHISSLKKDDPLFSSQKYLHKNNLTNTESYNKLPYIKVSNQGQSSYYSKYNSLFGSVGFGICSGMTGNVLSTPSILRNETEKLSFLKIKLNNKDSNPRFIKQSSGSDTHKKSETKPLKDEISSFRIEKSQTRINNLNKEIEIFEKKLLKLKSSPKLRISQKELYNIN